MNAQFILKARSARTVIAFALATLPMSLVLAQTANQDPLYSVVDRGPFYRVLQRTVPVTDSATGKVSQQVQSYVDLGTGMNYLSNGQWIESQDLIEVTPTGAQAVQGQMSLILEATSPAQVPSFCPSPQRPFSRKSKSH